jgi:hypothetical protein
MLEHARAKDKLESFMIGTASPPNGKLTRDWPHVLKINITFYVHDGVPIRNEVRSYMIDVDEIPAFMRDAADDYRATQIVEG